MLDFKSLNLSNAKRSVGDTKLSPGNSRLSLGNTKFHFADIKMSTGKLPLNLGNTEFGISKTKKSAGNLRCNFQPKESTKQVWPNSFPVASRVRVVRQLTPGQAQPKQLPAQLA